VGSGGASGGGGDSGGSIGGDPGSGGSVGGVGTGASISGYCGIDMPLSSANSVPLSRPVEEQFRAGERARVEAGLLEARSELGRVCRRCATLRRVPS
jgi:hypothetical protein